MNRSTNKPIKTEEVRMSSHELNVKDEHYKGQPLKELNKVVQELEVQLKYLQKELQDIAPGIANKLNQPLDNCKHATRIIKELPTYQVPTSDTTSHAKRVGRP